MRKMKSNSAELNRIGEMVPQNIQSLNVLNVNSVQYTIILTIQEMNLRGKTRGGFT
jgi:hypothetical protein